MAKRNGQVKMRKCACGCGSEFKLKDDRKLYLSAKHKNRAAQRRVRERSKGFGELQAEAQGAMGGNG